MDSLLILGLLSNNQFVAQITLEIGGEISSINFLPWGKYMTVVFENVVYEGREQSHLHQTFIQSERKCIALENLCESSKIVSGRL